MLSSHSNASSPLSPPEEPVIAAQSVGCCWARDGSLMGCYSDQDFAACRQKNSLIKRGGGHKQQPSFSDCRSVPTLSIWDWERMENFPLEGRETPV